MQKLFSYTFSQNIWRVIPDADPDSNQWVIELRDVSEKVVSLAVVDLAREELMWHGVPEGVDWWTSLTAFSYGRIFLHNYRYPEIPEPTDLLAVDGSEGQLLWALPNHILVKSLDKNHLEVARKLAGQFQYMQCEAASGEIMPMQEVSVPQSGEIILTEPIRYKEGNVYYPKLSSFITDITGGHIPLSIDYLEKRPYIIFSYYIYEQDKIVQYLLILTDRKELVLHEKLTEKRDGMGSSTMMLKSSTLVFLKNNNEFSSLTLS
ncbi:DUF4905 domain-containing protein [Dyadobacter pollutisoli]|uniref:DUF4905 domain-containing protein n=1 Tax=Dyadobacter pollutisoli TaxID=2910158 RepID=A0A9E8N4N1_9BACT|nr:DUF4905 domain-containing protein [Dyadobacter pollutisoli]WAC09709.1 DUF4905 domain-containing protein [Dyadobacter pollutisoli]